MSDEELEGLLADARSTIVAASLSMFFNASQREQNNALAAAGYGITNRGWIIETVLPKVHLTMDSLTRSRTAIDTSHLLDELRKATQA